MTKESLKYLFGRKEHVLRVKWWCAEFKRL